MKKICVYVDVENLFDNFSIQEVIELYGKGDVCKEISSKEYLEFADIDDVLHEIHNADNMKIGEFATEVYSE